MKKFLVPGAALFMASVFFIEPAFARIMNTEHNSMGVLRSIFYSSSVDNVRSVILAGLSLICVFFFVAGGIGGIILLLCKQKKWGKRLLITSAISFILLFLILLFASLRFI